MAALAIILGAGGAAVTRALDRPSSAPARSTAQKDGPADLSGSAGYLAEATRYAAFLQLTTSGTSVTGTWQSATLEGTTVRPASYTVAGSWDSAGHLTLTLGDAQTYSGTWQSDGLTVSIPQSDGSLASLHFAISDTTSYNAAVGALQSEAAHAAAVQQEQRQQAAASASAAASAAAAALEAARERSCVAINGHVDHTGGMLNGWCDSNVAGDPSGEAGSDCANAQLPFNDDGTIRRTFLETANAFYKGCWPDAGSVPSNVAR